MTEQLTDVKVFPQAMPSSESTVTQLEVISAIHHHARELARLTATWPSQPPVVTPTDYWRCPCCRNYYSGERLVCPISGDSRPSETTEGTPR